MPDGMMPGAVMMILMVIFMVLVLTGAVAGVVWLIRTLSDGRRSGASTAKDALELRYARGEIERDEYLRRRNDLDARA